ncbi:MAG TPA: cellulase family glycosylhydrolase [Solirubrobacterales bacterium]|nr:cellulase family glycosylhydrolase [Solirubrobacterales bacterium]
MRRLAVLLAAATALVGSSPASGAPTPPLGHEGRWITDDDGRVVILHGVNMVYKRPPYHPAAAGFDAPDVRFLARHGFNNVRLGLVYAGVEPRPGAYDRAYLRRVARTQELLADHRIFSMLDFHQDLYNERFTGEGWPDWAVLDQGLPSQPTTGFPATYLTSPGLNAAFDSFWANRAGPDGIGLQDHYASAWRRVALRFRRESYVMGYDLMNEPWPGSAWPACAVPLGCPGFEAGDLAAFHARVIRSIREVDRRNLVWYEPVVTTNFGVSHHHPDTGDPRAGLSFHIYCIAGAAALPGVDPLACPTLEELALENAIDRAGRNGDTLLLSEFGATADPAVIRRMVDLVDRHMISWQWWHYCGCDDPTTQGPGATQAIVADPARAPRGNNLLGEKLKLIERPYPQAVAGTPLRYGFEPDARRFELAYSTRSPSGERIRRRTPTEVYVPRIHYPDGYRVEVSGARLVSTRDARVLKLRRTRGARVVELAVRPR